MSVPLTEYVAAQARARLAESTFGGASLFSGLIEFTAWSAQTFAAPGNIVEQVRKQVRRGSLIATGVRVAPSAGSSPVQISGAAFASGRIRYLKNALVTADARYSNLRVIEKTALSRNLKITRLNQRVRQAAIASVIRALEKDGRLVGLRKQQAAIVRAALASAGIPFVGTDKTLERQIRIGLKLEKPN